MKLFSTLVLFFALVAAVCCRTQYWGNTNNRQVLLFNQQYVRSALRNNNWNINIEFPGNSQYNNRTITLINAVDNFRNQSGGYATLLSGGVGFRSVKLQLSSPRNVGLNTTVQIWGRK